MPQKTKVLDQYKNIRTSTQLYWATYGGWRAFFYSPYLHFALLLTCFFYFYLTKEDPWFDITLSVLPNLLGFTLGGYAILLAFGDDKFRTIIAGETTEGSASPFMAINGTFVHFIVIQAFAILYALIGKTWALITGWFAFAGLLLFLYSICTAVAAAFSILRLAKSFDHFQTENIKRSRKPKRPE